MYSGGNVFVYRLWGNRFFLICMLFSFTQNHFQWKEHLLLNFFERFFEFFMNVFLSYLLNVVSVKILVSRHFLFRMNKLILLVVLLFCTNLVVAHPTMLKRTLLLKRINSIPEICEEIEICKDYKYLFKIYRFCSKIYKCTQ